jgi:thioredoxin-related protein
MATFIFARIPYLMLRFILIITILSFSCRNDEQKQSRTVPEMDLSNIKKFILETKSIPNGESITQLDSILSNAKEDSAIFHQTVQYLQKPLSDPNSHFRNEILNIELLKSIVKSPWYDSLEKIGRRHDLNLALQNRPGNPANDFTFFRSDGDSNKMYDVRADYILLLFYNPECPACKDMKTAIMNSELINRSAAVGKLKILAIYTDADLTIWRKHLSEVSKKWIAGHDRNGELYAKSIYDVRVIPTIYLLDMNKTVILKDCMSIPLIEQKLAAN